MLKNYPKVSIITVNFRQNLTTLEFLKSIFSITYPNFEVLVVDNGSLAYPAEFVTQYPDIKLIVSRENKGFAGGNNLAIKESTGEYLLFINNDTEVEKGFIEPLVERQSALPMLAWSARKLFSFMIRKPYNMQVIPPLTR